MCDIIYIVAAHVVRLRKKDQVLAERLSKFVTACLNVKIVPC